MNIVTLRSHMPLDIVSFAKPAINQVFQTMLNTRLIEHGDKQPNGQFAIKEEKQIAASIGFTGAFTGVISLILGESLAVTLTKRMLSMDPHESVSTEYLKDALGELTNMVAGQVKTKLCDKGINTIMSVPVVIFGKTLNVDGAQHSKCQRIELLCESKPVVIQLIEKIT
jgi:chemotaxis protein CheX